MKQINIGGMTFAELREKGKYYVDKTLLIKDILDSDDSGVYLFTRPRRFGKTTNMSMLDAFFNISYKGNNWFDELEISKYPEYGKYRNIYPVIYLDLGLTKADSFESFLFRFRECIADIYDDHSYLLDSPELNYRTKQIFDSLMDGTIGEEDLIMSVRRLSLSLKSYHGISPIILIDEYDRAVSDSFGSESHRPMMTFLSSFMYNSIKGNANRSLVYVTGVM
ncbi:MAG: AAA family ATPase, partial [Candidatus Methanomethylophilaceae archaeon]